MIKNGVIYRRYDAKNGKTPPPGFIPAQDPDPVTGHWPGWVECSRADKGDKFRFEAFDACGGNPITDGTFELCGPRINGNPEHFVEHRLVPHGYIKFEGAPRTFDALKQWFAGKNIEGIVWHHPDGRMVKIKKKDFGLKRSD